MLVLIIGVIVALFGGLEAQGFLPKFTQQSYLDIAMSVYGLGWVFVFAAILIGLVIYFDLFAILAISSAWALSFLPIPTLWGRFGPNGSSLGWHQARELLRNQGQAQLFWIEERGVERVSAAVFQKLATEPLDGRDVRRGLHPWSRRKIR